MPLQSLVKKNGPLSADEIKLIHEHPYSGADMLPPGFSGLALQAIRQHHENNDGSGYPCKLSGSRIGFLHVFYVSPMYTAQRVVNNSTAKQNLLHKYNLKCYMDLSNIVIIQLF